MSGLLCFQFCLGFFADYISTFQRTMITSRLFSFLHSPSPLHLPAPQSKQRNFVSGPWFPQLVYAHAPCEHRCLPALDKA